MPSPFTAYLAGIATVIVSLGAGFAGGAVLGTTWGPGERPAVAKVEQQTTALAPRREIPIIQQAQSAVAQFNADRAADRANAENERLAEARKAEKVAEARKVADQRKAAAAARKLARAERREAERKRQMALGLARQQQQQAQSQAQAPLSAPALGFAPVASTASPLKAN